MTGAPLPRFLSAVRRFAPGLGLAAAIAAAATMIGSLVPLVGAAVPGLLIGAAISTVHRPGARVRPGIDLAAKRVLQISVVLLGTQLSVLDVARVGVAGLPVTVGTLAVGLGAAWALGRVLRVGRDTTVLIGVGTGVCGASAIAATAPVIGAAAADVAYAVSTIFAFNIAAVLLFPLIGHLLGMSQAGFGLFAGTAVNDTSSVVAAAAAYGPVATDHAIVVKLVRALAIIPITLVLAAVTRRRDRSPGVPRPAARGLWDVVRLVPWFLVGFVLMAVLNSLGLVPAAAHPPLSAAAGYLIAVALSAIGLSVDLAAMRRAGWRPLLLGGSLWVVVSVTSLGLQALTGST